VEQAILSAGVCMWEIQMALGYMKHALNCIHKCTREAAFISTAHRQDGGQILLLRDWHVADK
jgi:hypothetical protein